MKSSLILGDFYLSTTEVALSICLNKKFAFTMWTKCRRIFIEQVRTARPNISDADIITIIETHFADWFNQNISK